MPYSVVSNIGKENFTMDEKSIASLRGTQKLSLDARVIEQAARSGCTRYRTAVSAGISPDNLSIAVYGDSSGDNGISPFARAIGIAFEHWLIDKDAFAMKEAYDLMAGWRPEIVENFIDLLDSNNLAEAEARTAEVIDRRIKTGEGPNLIFGARLSLVTASGAAHVRPDLLIARPGWKHFRVGEIKSYLDLDGRTDGTEIGKAVRQASVGIVAMRQNFGVDSTEDEVDLILRVARNPGATVRTLDAGVEVSSIMEFISLVPKEIKDALEITGGLTLSSKKSLEKIPHRFEPACKGACALYESCHTEAIANDELSLLGPNAVLALEGVSGLSRAIELASGAIPLNEEEERVAPSLVASWEMSESLEKKYPIG